MSIKVAYIATLKTTEILTVNAAHQASGNAVISQLSTNVMDQTDTSTPPCSLRAGEDRSFIGSGTLDLAALLGTGGVAVDGTGKKLQYLKLVNAGTIGPITIAKDTVNGYDGLGSFSLTIGVGGEAMFKLNSAGSVIGSGNKRFSLAGTGTLVLSYEAVIG